MFHLAKMNEQTHFQDLKIYESMPLLCSLKCLLPNFCCFWPKIAGNRDTIPNQEKNNVNNEDFPSNWDGCVVTNGVQFHHMTSLEGSVLQRFFSEENNESWTLSWFASVFFQVLFFVKGSDLHSWKIIGIYNIGIMTDSGNCVLNWGNPKKQKRAMDICTSFLGLRHAAG